MSLWRVESFESISDLESRISAALDSRDSDFVGEDEDGFIVIKNFPPGQMIRIRKDQVENNAGGFVFAVSDETRVRRFLILGCASGTYYVSKEELEMDNIDALKDIIHRGKASLILKEIREISLAGRNPKQQPVMMALALCARYRVGDVGGKDKKGTSSHLYAAYLKQVHKEAFALVNEVCRIPTHLFMFVKYCEAIAGQTAEAGKGKSTGWGRLMRKVIQNWYLSKSAEQLAIHITKYGKREGWSHGDLLRLSHPVPPNGPNQKIYDSIFYFALHGTLDRKRPAEEEKGDAKKAKVEPRKESTFTKEQLEEAENSKALAFLAAFETLNKDSEEKDILNAITTYGMVREHVPTEHLNSRAIWAALLKKMPMTAMIRNLAKMQTIGLLEGEEAEKVESELTDESKLKAARIHPIQLLLAKGVYDRGAGEKGSLKWTPDQKVSDALESAFYKAFVNVEPTGKRFCLAFDVSGSMTQQILGTAISARQASSAIGMTLLRREEHVETVAFCDELVPLAITSSMTLGEVSNVMDNLRFGSTDCALPMLWAAQNKKEFDVFVVFTDNETYFGNTHPFEAMRAYREKSGIQARLIVCGMTASNFTIADPTDAGMLDIAGFDAAVPELIANFVTGKI